MKRFFVLTLSLMLMSLSLHGCSEKEPIYADDVSCSELMDTLEKQIPVPFGYETYSPEQIQFYFENTDDHDDACLRYSKQSENINEIGIFHAPDAQARKELEGVIDRYLDELRTDQSAFIGSYAPEELPKLEGAEQRSYGNYTVYVILEEADRELIFETVEKLLQREAKQ